MTDTCEIRRLDAEDHLPGEPLWRGYQSFYQVDIPDAVSSVTWSRLVDPTGPMSGALAWTKGGTLGLVYLIRHRSCWTTGDYCCLKDLFVIKRARGAGIARKLIEHVYAEATRQGCSRVYWLTHESNAAAMQRYDRIAERSGFVEYRHSVPAAAGGAKA